MQYGMKYFILFFILLYNIYAKEKDINVKKNECKNNDAKLCVCVRNLINSLEILEIIQKSNFALLQQSLKNKQKDIDNQEITSHKTLQKDHIISIKQDEYNSLKQYMEMFCDCFKQLNQQEVIILFSLTWNNKLLFQDIKDVNAFCKHKY